MKLRTLLENVGGRYNAQLEVFDFSAQELELMGQFGEPLIEIGGAFSGNVARPGVSNTTMAINSGSGSGATASPIVSGGVIVGAAITNPGTGYTSATVAFSGGGSGAAGTVKYGIVGVTITGGGSGYAVNDVIAYNAVNPGEISAQIRVLTVNAGVITSAEIISSGTFNAVPSNPVTLFTSSGAGTGASLTFSWGVVAVVITNGGTGYNLNPVTINYTLGTAQRRLKTDSPFKQVFDLQDFDDADARAKLWLDTISSRCIKAKLVLLSQSSTFAGETVTTV